jgi:tripartite-type tricarboxylate transporter receptor subunit TctC
MKSRRTVVKGVLAAAGALALPRPSRADVFPARPIKLICPFPPGPATDAIMRAMAASASKTLSGTVFVENKAGAAGTLGAIEVAKATPDGYVLTSLPDAFYIQPHLNKVSYDPLSDFTYIVCLFAYTYGLVVRADSPFKTLQDVVAYAKANPGKFTYATAGVATMNQLIMERLAHQLGLKWVNVPYRGSAPATLAILAGEVMATSGASDWAAQVDDGKLRLIVTYGSVRTTRWPHVPTLKDLGYDVVADGPTGFAGPKGMDPDVTRRLHDAFKLSLEDPAVKRQLEANSMRAFYRNSADYAKLASEMYAQAKSLVESAGLGPK